MEVSTYVEDDTRPIKSYKGGSRRSIKRLEYLGFDPIKALVDKYNEIESEVLYQKKLRSKEIIELDSKGKEKSFYAPNLYELFDKQITIADKLLKYRYGAVNEDAEESGAKPAQLTVILHNEGEIYSVGDTETTDSVDEDTWVDPDVSTDDRAYD